MEIYKNKYRIASIRAQWWDYGWNGAYFITICTLNREYFFGQSYKHDESRLYNPIKRPNQVGLQEIRTQ